MTPNNENPLRSALLRENLLRSLILSTISVLLLLIVGVLVLNWQLWSSAQDSRENVARHAMQKMTQILEEAQKAQAIAVQVAQAGCSPQGHLELGTQAALLPHLRTLIIIKDGKVWCSSLPGHGVLTIHPERMSLDSLLLLSRNQTINRLPILVLQSPVPGGRVLVTISDTHLRAALNSRDGDMGMRLVVGEYRLGRVGDVQAHLTDDNSYRGISSERYPFSIEYRQPPFFDLMRLLQKGGSLLVMVVLMAIGIEVVFRRYAEKSTSPEENLRQAINNGEIIPFYQPVVNGKTGAIYGVEVLARWRSPQVGLLPAPAFIPMAERSGLIIPLTKSVMQQVAQQIKPILSKLPDGFHIGINVAAAHINSPGFLADCTSFLAQFDGKPITLVLEVTEREPLLITSQLIEKLNTLHSQGLLIALDDFGTGYCGLSYLNDLAIDYIKIDQSFVGRVSDEKDSTKLLDCVIEMAKKLSLRIVAEGVETQAQLDYLNARNITLLQGYFFSKPVSFAGLNMILLSKQKEEIVIA